MKRRDFLKSVSAVLAGAPIAGLMVKEVTAKGGVIGRVSKDACLLETGEAVVPIRANIHCEHFATSQMWSYTFYSEGHDGKRIELKTLIMYSDGSMFES
jgi:hypothetical protein